MKLSANHTRGAPLTLFLGAPLVIRYGSFPQEEQEGVLYAGIAGDEIESGLFEGEALSLQLVGSRGPGNVSPPCNGCFWSPTGVL